MRLIVVDNRIKEPIADRFPGHEVELIDGRSMNADEFVSHVRDADAIGLRRLPGFTFDRSVVESLSRLKFAHKTGTGMDWFDVAACTDLGILLANNDGFNAASVSEHAMLLTLLCLRGTFDWIVQMRNGVWNRDLPPQGVLGLEGKTVGIVGLGKIGAHLARRAAAFGAEILGHQRTPRPELSILGGVRWVGLDDLLRQSDVVVLAVPLTPQTERMIGARELSLMKPTAVLVNVARGKVVDEQALYETLAARIRRAAGIDVFEQEPTPADNPLLKLDNVIATPHLGGYSADQVTGMLENLALFAAGRRPLRLINPEIIDRGAARAGSLR